VIVAFARTPVETDARARRLYAFGNPSQRTWRRWVSLLRRRLWLVTFCCLPGCSDAPRHASDARAARFTYELERERPVAADFGSIAAAAVTPSGRLVVADALSAQILLFAEDGTELDRAGGAGSGPGEFASLADLAVGAADTVFALDIQHQRITAYALQGDSFALAYARSVPVSGPISGYAYRIMASPISGLILGYKTVSTRTRGKGSVILRLVDRSAIVVQDSILVVPADEVLFSDLFGPAIAPMPYGRSTLLRLGPGGGIYYGWTGATGIEVYTPRGARETTIAIPAPAPARITREMIEVLLRSVSGPTREIIEDAYERNLLPTKLPVFRDFVVASDGRVWIDLFTPADTLISLSPSVYYRSGPSERGRSWLILDPQQPRAAVTALVPSGARLFAVSSTHAYGIERDTLGVEALMRYRTLRHPRLASTPPDSSSS